RTTRSSSRLTKNTEPPGSPCRPARPRSWSSTRRLSCRPHPITYSPPRAATRSRSDWSLPPSRMSTPRPAICVETVTRPYVPASAMIAASSASFLALRTTQGTPASRSAAARVSDSLTSRVPMSTGRPVAWHSTTSSISAASRSWRLAYSRSGSSTRLSRRCRGSTATSREKNSRSWSPTSTAAVGDPAPELVHQVHLAVPDDVVDVPVHQRAGVQGDVHRRQLRRVLLRVQVDAAERALHRRGALGRQRHAAAVLGDVVVDPLP